MLARIAGFLQKIHKNAKPSREFFHQTPTSDGGDGGGSVCVSISATHQRPQGVPALMAIWYVCVCGVYRYRYVCVCALPVRPQIL